jgi:colanic acid/amylovoran biosynthesis glycosyltransferase
VWVVGDRGAEATSIDVQSLAVKLGIESQVAFFGRLSGTALKAVYRACDVFCLPCRVDSDGVAEGFPNVLIEAMAIGKPVITTRHVEIPRIIKEIVVDENDIDGLAQAIEKVYQSAELRQNLGRQNRELAQRHFSPRNADKTARILHALAHQNNLENIN